jgi:hypothetical protein
MKALFLFSVFWWVCFSGCSKLAPNSPENTNSTCLACHAVPPADRVHAAHTVRQHYDCALCHPGAVRGADSAVVPAEAIHANGIINVVFSFSRYPLESGVYDSGAKTCNSVYCHGYFPGGDSGTVGVNDSIYLKQCASCNNIQQMTAAGHFGMKWSTITNCSLCHTGYNYADQTVNDATHIDGRNLPVDCLNCHSTVPQ